MYFRQVSFILFDNATKYIPALKEVSIPYKDFQRRIKQNIFSFVFDITTKIIGKANRIEILAARKFIEVHGGKASAQNEQDNGTTFTICLPTVLSKQTLELSN